MSAGLHIGVTNVRLLPHSQSYTLLSVKDRWHSHCFVKADFGSRNSFYRSRLITRSSMAKLLDPVNGSEDPGQPSFAHGNTQ